MKFLSFAAAAVMAATPVLAQESTDPIKLTLHDWSGQLITTTLMGEVLKEAGYNVEYVQADYIAQFAGLKTGDLHVAIGNLGDDRPRGDGRGRGHRQCRQHGRRGYDRHRGMVVSRPIWKSAAPACRIGRRCRTARANLPRPKRRRWAVIWAGPVTWGGFDEERVEALGLDFEVVHAGTDAALFAELESAYQREARSCCGSILRIGRPRNTRASIVEFPPYSTECYEDPSDGVNPDAAYDCGKPTGPIWKVAWAGVEEKWPGAAEIIRDFHPHQRRRWARWCRPWIWTESPLTTVAAEWMARNEAKVDGWIN